MSKVEKKIFKLIKKCKLKIVICIFIFILLGIGGYAYFSSSSSEAGIINKITSGVKSIVKSEKILNYTLETESSFDIKINGASVNGSFQLTDAEIYSADKGLKQSLSIGAIGGLINMYGATSSGMLSDINFVSDNEKLYFSLGKGFKEISELLAVMTSSDTVSNISSVLEKDKYVMIDNSKPIIKMFGELAQNDLVKKILIGSITSNPEAYYSKNGVNKEFKEFIASAKFLDYIFVDGKIDSITGKTNLTVNSEICKDYAPIIVNFLNETGVNSISSSEELIAQCQQIIAQSNMLLPMFLQSYKEGDIKNGNFKLVLASGGILDINIDYKENTISNWYISAKAPDNSINITINGDVDKLVSSLIKVNFENDGLKIIGEITDGKGKIEISLDEEGAKLLGNLNFDEYMPLNYDIVFDLPYQGAKVNLVAKGDRKKGNIELMANHPSYGVIIDGSLNYTQSSYDMIFSGKEGKNSGIIFSSSYKDSIFKLNLAKAKENVLLSKVDLEYNKGKINGILFEKESGKKIELNGNYNNKIDFDITIASKNDGIEANIKSIVKSPSEIDYIYFTKAYDEEVINATLNIKKLKENGYKITDLSLIANLDSFVKASLESNLKIKIKKGGAKYKIPTNYDEVDIKITEIFNLPNFSYKPKFGQKEAIIGATGGAILGTMSFMSLQGYSSEAKNSKRISDISNIKSTVYLKNIEGNPLSTLIIRDVKYEGKDLYIEGIKLVGGGNYIVGTPNYKALGIRKKDFLDPNGEEYIIGATTVNGGKIQILALMERDKFNRAYIEGSYIGKDGDTKGLIYINGKTIKNGDFIY